MLAERALDLLVEEGSMLPSEPTAVHLASGVALNPDTISAAVLASFVLLLAVSAVILLRRRMT